MSIFQKVKEGFITVSLTILTILICINAGLIYYNKLVMEKNNTLQKQVDAVKTNWSAVFESNLRRMDLGLRGYALTRNAGVLSPYRDGMRDMPRTLKNIDSLLVLQGLDSIKMQFDLFKPKVQEFIDYSAKMKEFAEAGDLETFVKMLNEDKGFSLWQAFSPMITAVNRYEDRLVEQARNDYQQALSRNVIFQVILVILTVPTLIAVMLRIRRDAKNRKKLLANFEQNNRKYMFDSGHELDTEEAQVIIQSSIRNMKKASKFIKDIAGGNYSATWDGLTPENAQLNQDNLAGDLIKMRDQMKKVKELDEKRIWSTEGLAQFSDVARNNQNNIESLSNEVIRFLTKHLKAQQGSLFVLRDEEGQDPYLEMTACYAFDKKKFVERKIDVGSGLVGQAFLEGGTILLTQVPTDYISITSGLGHATPNCVIIVPMKYNERVEAVLELASFSKFEPHEVEFLEKAGEVIASSIYATKTNERTSKLLQETQEQAEALRSQEEELRQNMEELQATQEDMRRRERHT